MSKLNPFRAYAGNPYEEKLLEEAELMVMAQLVSERVGLTRSQALAVMVEFIRSPTFLNTLLDIGSIKEK